MRYERMWKRILAGSLSLAVVLGNAGMPSTVVFAEEQAEVFAEECVLDASEPSGQETDAVWDAPQTEVPVVEALETTDTVEQAAADDVLIIEDMEEAEASGEVLPDGLSEEQKVITEQAETDASEEEALIEDVELTQEMILAEEQAALAGDEDGITEPEGVQSLACGQEVSVTISEEGGYQWFKIIPEKTQKYVFYSTTTEDVDPYGTLYAENADEVLASNDDGVGDRNFRVEYILKAGNVYYFKASCYSDIIGTYVLKMEEMLTESIELDYETDRVIKYGQNEELSVLAAGPDGVNLSYQWYVQNEEGEYEILANQTSDTLVVTNVVQMGYYKCEVSAEGYETANAYITVEVDTELEVVDSSGDISIKPGTTGTLTIEAESGCGREISYRWYDEDDENTVLSETASLTVSQAGDYRCVVSDGINKIAANFCVEIDSGLDAHATNGNSFMVSSGQSVTLGVTATTEASNALTYKWAIYNEQEYEYTDLTQTTANLNVSNITKTAKYRCNVSDTYDTVRVYFYIYLREGDPATSFSTAQQLNCGQASAATILNAGEMMYYRIVPATSGTYIFYSIGNVDTYGTLYDANCNELISDDDSLDCDSNFLIQYALTAGTTYYLGARMFSSSDIGSFYVMMDMEEPSCYHSSLSEWTTVTQPACTTAGTMARLCTSCHKAVMTKSIAATGHNLGDWVTVTQPTCTTAGTMARLCTSCHKAVMTKSIAATGHSYGSWKTTRAATVFSQAIQTRTCTKCGATETREVGSKLKATIKVNATSVPLKAGQSTTKVKVTKLAAGDSVKSWKSSNTKVVTVTKSGKITAKKSAAGKKATVTITLASGLKKKITVTVQKGTVQAKKITGVASKITLKKGKKTTLKPVVTPVTTAQTAKYSSSNKKVATVSSKGVITAKKKGTATITVKVGSKSVKCKVTVK